MRRPDHLPADDDAPVGRVLTRRDALVLLGGAGAYLWVAGCGGNAGEAAEVVGSPLDCVARPEMTEGPYYVDGDLTRADIRAGTGGDELQAGIPLALALHVSRLGDGGCTPLAGAVVDVWHCNALGVYSGVVDPSFDTTGQTWLRGNQTTDAEGKVSFTTIFPGWYPGRASHIHFKIRSAAGADRAYEFVSQLFFPEPLLTSIYTERQPYAEKGDEGRERNASDGIYREGGSQLMLAPTRSGEGYAASFSIGLQTDG